MTVLSPQDKEYFGELIVKAVQSGKNETSGLFANIKYRMDESDSERHSLHEKIDSFVNQNNIKWEEQNKRWDDAKDVLDMGKNIAGFTKIAKIILAVCAAVGSIWFGFLWVFNNFFNHN